MIKIITTNRNHNVEFTVQEFEALVAEIQKDAYQTGYNDAKEETNCNCTCNCHKADENETSCESQDENHYESVTDDGIKFTVDKTKNGKKVSIKQDKPLNLETFNRLISEVIK